MLPAVGQLPHRELILSIVRKQRLSQRLRHKVTKTTNISC
jgi:hypothetical protein